MRKLTTLIIALFFCSLAYSQETVKWASEVMYVTSETTALQYAASQALHSPNVYPKGEENPNAWRPAKSDNKQYIVVKFDLPIRAQQIAIAETENPGAVSKVYAYDSLDNEYLLFELNPRPIPLQSRLLNLFFEKTPYRIAYVRVEMEGSKVPGFNSIDAIGLSSSNIPISVLIELAAGMNQDLETEPLSKNVNSEYLEQSPLLSPDGKTLYFSRRGHPDNVGGVDDYEDIWYSELDEEKQEWLPAKNLGAPLNNAGANFICSITQVNGETILLLGNRYEKKGRMTQGISMSRSKSSGKWEKPTNLEVENDYNYSEKVDYYMSQKADVIMMSVERDDSYGDRDLYASFVGADGVWSEPKNLGNVINSADTESAPFLAGDNQTLYFTSKGFRGYGGADIYVSKRLDDTWTNWSAPENLGSGVNGPSDDTYFNLPPNGSHAYFSRGKTDENTDVYRFRIDELFNDPSKVEELIASNKENYPEIIEEEVVALVEEPVAEVAEIVEPKEEPIAEVIEPVKPKEEPAVVIAEDIFVDVTGRVIDTKTGLPMMGTVIVERLPDGLFVGETKTDSNGRFSFNLRGGAKYGILAKKEGYMAQHEHLDFNDLAASMAVEKELKMSPIEKGAAIVLNNIFFDFDAAELKTSSYAELERLAELLKLNKIERIEISGHTDSVGDDDYNLGLSKRRAWAVYSYFISKGIKATRLESVGYGETITVAPNDTPANRSKNRRVEFKVLD